MDWRPRPSGKIRTHTHMDLERKLRAGCIWYQTPRPHSSGFGLPYKRHLRRSSFNDTNSEERDANLCIRVVRQDGHPRFTNTGEAPYFGKELNLIVLETQSGLSEQIE